MFTPLVQTVEIAWSADLRVIQCVGDAADLFNEEDLPAEGRSLHTLLKIAPERAARVDAIARAHPGAPATEFVTQATREPRTFRLTLAVRDGVARAAVLDMNKLLAGAPPLQISALSSSLSHEIRNPLSSVKMAVQTLQRNTTLSPRDQRRLTIADREVRTMERMLGLLAEYGRDQSPNLEPLPLRQLVLDAHGLIRPELTERKIELLLVEEDEDITVRADALRLRLVLGQLLLNVALGHEEGQSLRVVLRAHPGGGGTVEVLDPNAAMPPEEEQRLFEPFGSRLARGAGLSLAALKRVLKMHGGDVTAEGSADPGTRFTLLFPA